MSFHTDCCCINVNLHLRLSQVHRWYPADTPLRWCYWILLCRYHGAHPDYVYPKETNPLQGDHTCPTISEGATKDHVEPRRANILSSWVKEQLLAGHVGADDWSDLHSDQPLWELEFQGDDYRHFVLGRWYTCNLSPPK